MRAARKPRAPCSASAGPFGARLLINDDLALALAVRADGVHLGAADGDLRAARRALASGRLLGASCYADFERARGRGGGGRLRRFRCGPSLVDQASGGACAALAVPGGVNSPVRAFRSVGGTPRFFCRAKGPRVGRRRQDLSRLRRLLGAADPRPRPSRGRRRRAGGGGEGLSFGAPTEREVEMAELLCSMLPSLDMVRLVSSGTEATMSAIRLARGFTGRDC
jgi:hypothetical protein